MKINGQITVADFEVAANKHSKAKRKKNIICNIFTLRSYKNTTENEFKKQLSL